MPDVKEISMQGYYKGVLCKLSTKILTDEEYEEIVRKLNL